MKRLGLLFIMLFSLSVIGQTEVYKLKIENTPNGSLTNDVLLSKKPSGLVRQLDTSVFLDNTDEQILSVDGQDLTISGGNTIILPSSPMAVSNGLSINPLTGDAELGGTGLDKFTEIPFNGNTLSIGSSSESRVLFFDEGVSMNIETFNVNNQGNSVISSQGSTNIVSEDGILNIQSDNSDVSISSNNGTSALNLANGIATLSANVAAYVNASGEIALESGVVRLEAPNGGYIGLTSGGSMLLSSDTATNITSKDFVNIQSSNFTQISGGVVDGYVNLEAADVRLNPRVGKTPEIGDTWVCTNTDGSGEWSTPPVGFTGSFPSGSGATEVTVTVVNGLITDIQ